MVCGPVMIVFTKKMKEQERRVWLFDAFTDLDCQGKHHSPFLQTPPVDLGYLVTILEVYGAIAEASDVLAIFSAVTEQ